MLVQFNPCDNIVDNIGHSIDGIVDASARQRTLLMPDPKLRGYRKLFMQSVLQADQGCDFDFLLPTEFTGRVPRSNS